MLDQKYLQVYLVGITVYVLMLLEARDTSTQCKE